jgi:hypothetical protein
VRAGPRTHAREGVRARATCSAASYATFCDALALMLSTPSALRCNTAAPSHVALRGNTVRERARARARARVCARACVRVPPASGGDRSRVEAAGLEELRQRQRVYASGPRQARCNVKARCVPWGATGAPAVARARGPQGTRSRTRVATAGAHLPQVAAQRLCNRRLGDEAEHRGVVQVVRPHRRPAPRPGPAAAAQRQTGRRRTKARRTPSRGRCRC